VQGGHQRLVSRGRVAQHHLRAVGEQHPGIGRRGRGIGAVRSGQLEQGDGAGLFDGGQRPPAPEVHAAHLGHVCGPGVRVVDAAVDELRTQQRGHRPRCARRVRHHAAREREGRGDRVDERLRAGPHDDGAPEPAALGGRHQPGDRHGGGQLQQQLVGDRPGVGPLADDVQGQDVGAGAAQCRGELAKLPRLIGDLHV
jgi:hypothetical protein